MRRFPRLHIKEKLVLITTATCGFALLLVAVLGYFYSRHDYRRELERELTSNARFLAFNSAAAIEFDSPEEAGEGLGALRVRRSIVGAAIFKLDGELFATYRRDDDAEVDFETVPRTLGSHYYGDRMAVVESIEIGGSPIAIICVVSDLQELHARMRRNVFAGGVIFAGIALVSLLVSFRLQRFISEPVGRLAETARTISERKDYSLRAHVRSGDELGALADQFNQMLDEIQRQDRALRESHDRLEHRVHERTQALKAAKDEAEAASRAKGEFLATMSHELRTPLNGISGMMELLADSELTEEQRERVRVVCYSADALVTIVNDILDFSKIEAGKLELEPRAFDLEELVHSVGELLSINAAVKGVDMVAHFGARAPRRVIGDDGRIRQILLNVAGNAVKFTERGRVFIQADCTEARNGHLLFEFTVEDTGVGIAEDKIEFIFETFTQADASTTRRFGGTGLGLAITRRLVELMGGAIGIESSLGEGTTVRFTLALERDPAGATEARPARATILLLDDDDATRSAYADTLGRWGFSVVCAPTETDDIREAATGNNNGNGNCRLVLLNSTSVGDAADVLRAIRSVSSLASVPVITLGSPARPQDPEEIAGAGSDKYIEAYMTPSRLFDAIVAVLPGEQDDTPRGSDSQPAAAEIPNGPAAGGNIRILLVEDNVVNQKVAAGFLKRLGLHAEIAADGQKAVDRVREERFDLIFMDVQMPVMDGLTATTELRKLPNGERVPVVAMTANAMLEDRDRCLAAGMDDYLSKPLQGKLVQRMVAKYLGKHAADAGRAKSFLIVAENEEALEPIASTIRTRWPGARVQPAYTGVEACVRIGSRLPDCVIVDAAFDGLDLAALGAYLQSEERYRGLHLILWGKNGGDQSDAPGAPIRIRDGQDLPLLARVLAGKQGGAGSSAADDAPGTS